MNDDEFRTLIDDALEATISDADFLRLEAELLIDPVARRKYYDRVYLSTLLEAEATSQPEQSGDLPLVSSGIPGRRRQLAIVSITAICASLLLVIVWQTGLRNTEQRLLMEDIGARHFTNHQSPIINHQLHDSPDTAAGEQQSSGFAVLSGQADAVWGDTVLSTGTIVPPGELRLQSGLAQFELFSGVTLVVEGEASFSILSPMEVSVSSGKVRARVPEPAQGFRLLTEAGEVVDLGTEFAVNVSANQAELHVLDGMVEWHPTGFPAQLLKEGDATRADTHGQTKITA
ncbi:MAG: FecR domain-containing protein, partial [Planctomycetaceae bacterium]|nr:FecR domain-containing protein [Planctomycetaceae bacterium]